MTNGPCAEEESEFSTTAATALRPRAISPEQVRKFEGYVAEMFAAMGLDLSTPATRDTPRRHVQAMLDITSGYEGVPPLRPEGILPSSVSSSPVV